MSMPALRSPPPRIGSRKNTTGAPGSSQARRSSVSGLNAGVAKRTSKTSQKLVVLPSEPQTKPLLDDELEDLTLGYETDAGVTMREYKSEGERMSKDQRRRAGYKRITAYCVAESFNMKLMTSFLKREHNVSPRIYDEALYAIYYLPLLPGYGPGSNIRSSAPTKSAAIKNILSRAEENGYQGTYFTQEQTLSHDDGYMTSSPPKSSVTNTSSSQYERTEPQTTTTENPPELSSNGSKEDVAEAVFFEYGVAVFFGMDEAQERSILEDVQNAETMYRRIPDADWEIEECHFAHDPNIAYPRIYNDFFTLKSHSHLLKLSIAHAFAQSTLLSRFETIAQRVLLSPQTLSIPKQLARSGKLQLRRHEALKLTGRLFKLRRDVNLVSNVLDVPELFWSEASLKELYDAVRDYMEITSRVQALNEKLAVASDFLDAIHDHLNNSAMDRITWIVIWLIVAAIVVELGEVLARLVFHEAVGNRPAIISKISQNEALLLLERMSGTSGI